MYKRQSPSTVLWAFHTIQPSSFYLLSSFFPRLISAAVNWMYCLPYFHTWCGLSANWRCRSETCCTRLAGNAERKKVAKNRHLSTIAQLYQLYRAMSSQLRHLSTIGKKLVKQQYLLHMSSQYGKLQATNGCDRLTSFGHPCKFQLVSRLVSVTARHLVVGVSQTLRRWTEGATYIWQGHHHVGHWPAFLVLSFFSSPNLSGRRLDVYHTSTHCVALVWI